MLLNKKWVIQITNHELNDNTLIPANKIDTPPLTQQSKHNHPFTNPKSCILHCRSAEAMEEVRFARAAAQEICRREEVEKVIAVGEN